MVLGDGAWLNTALPIHHRVFVAFLVVEPMRVPLLRVMDRFMRSIEKLLPKFTLLGLSSLLPSKKVCKFSCAMTAASIF